MAEGAVAIPEPIGLTEVVLDQEANEEEPLVGPLERPFFEMERLERSNYLVETKRTEHCCSFVYTWVFFFTAAVTLYFIIERDGSLGLLGVVIPAILFALCYCVAYDIRNDPEFKKENWKTLDEALEIVENGVKNKPYFNFELKRKYEYRADPTVAPIVSDTHDIERWLDYSTPVTFLRERSKILKLHIRKYYRIDGDYAAFNQAISDFETNTRQQNVTHENYKGSKYEVQDLPDVIMVNPNNRDRVSIPWFYNQTCYYITQICCFASYVWKRIVNGCCSEQLVYTSLKVMRDDDKIVQEQIDELKQEWHEEI